MIVHSSGECTLLKRTGPALGIIPEAEFAVQEVQLCEGDLFFAFTDGASDALNPVGDRFGRDRLRSLLHADISAESLLAHVHSQLDEYTAEANQFDDITLLAVRRCA